MTPEQVDKLISFGKMALEQGWYDQAREYFEQALVLDLSNREAMTGGGITLSAMQVRCSGK